jgi:hypothetical protein
MPRFQVAHVKELGVDLIIIPLESSFGNKNSRFQRSATAELQARATSAGLAGTVVPVWDTGDGRMGFLAPPNWHPFFAGLTLEWVFANINRQLYW